MKEKDNKKVMMTVYVDSDVYERYKELSKYVKISMNSIINKGLYEYLDGYLNPDKNYMFTPKRAILVDRDENGDICDGQMCTWICDRNVGKAHYCKIIVNKHDIVVPRSDVLIQEDIGEIDIDDLYRVIGEKRKCSSSDSLAGL